MNGAFWGGLASGFTGGLQTMNQLASNREALGLRREQLGLQRAQAQREAAQFETENKLNELKVWEAEQTKARQTRLENLYQIEPMVARWGMTGEAKPEELELFRNTTGLNPLDLVDSSKIQRMQDVYERIGTGTLHPNSPEAIETARWLYDPYLQRGIGQTHVTPDGKSITVTKKTWGGIAPAADQAKYPDLFEIMVNVEGRDDQGNPVAYNAPLSLHGSHWSEDPQALLGQTMLEGLPALALRFNHKFTSNPNILKALSAHVQSGIRSTEALLGIKRDRAAATIKETENGLFRIDSATGVGSPVVDQQGTPLRGLGLAKQNQGAARPKVMAAEGGLFMVDPSSGTARPVRDESGQPLRGAGSRGAVRPQIRETADGFVMIDPATGAVTPVQDAQGNPLKGAAGGKLTEQQAKATGYATWMKSALETVDQLEQGGFVPDWGTSVQKGLGRVGQYLGFGKYAPLSERGQLYMQGAEQFINALLRTDTGAAYAQHEPEDLFRIFFPQPGDAPAVIEQKRRERGHVLQAVMSGTGAGRRTVEGVSGGLPGLAGGLSAMPRQPAAPAGLELAPRPQAAGAPAQVRVLPGGIIETPKGKFRIKAYSPDGNHVVEPVP
jgi:hypothetical protein